MAHYNPVDRNLIRMELRRFQTLCEAQEGSIQRADTIREVARLARINLPFALNEETAALDARAQIRRTAELRARDLIDEQCDRLVKCEPMARDKVLRQLGEELIQLTGSLSSLRIWAQGRIHAATQLIQERS
jgi:hypothetical protein